MRTNWILSTAVSMAVTAAVGAQSAPAMATPAQGDNTTVTYTGCVESVNHGAAFLLTRVDRIGADSMRGDVAMKHPDTAMKGEAAKTMQHEQTPTTDDKMDAKASKSFALAGSANLSKHVGQKVSVTGSLSDGSMGTMRQEGSTLTVKMLKVIAKSCS
jgi:hypothetical protein